MKNANMKKMISIKAKIVGVVSVTLAILFIVMGYFVLSNVDKKIDQEEIENIKITDEFVKAKVEGYFDNYFSTLEQLANDQNVINYAATLKKGENHKSNEYYFDMMKSLKAAHQTDADNILSTAIASISGDLTITSTDWVSGSDFDMTTREWYKSVTENRSYIPEPYVDSASGKQAVCLATPIKKDGEIVGAINADIDITILNNFIKNQKLGDSGYYILLTSKNIVLSHSNSDYIMKDINQIELDKKIIDAVNNGNSSKFEYKNNGEMYYGGCTNIGDTGWKIIAALPMAEFNKISNLLFTIISCILIAAFALIIIVLVLFVNKFINPLNKLTAVTKKLADGNLDVIIDIKSNDEVGLLAVSLGDLVNRLKEYIIYINEISYSLDLLSNGELEIELKQSYDGEFSKIKVALTNLLNILSNTIGNIATVSNQVNSGADQVAGAAQALSQGATEQASSIQELSATISDISQQIKSNAKNANIAGSTSADAGKGVSECNNYMKQMTEAMNDIAKKSNEIENIIKTIDDIAFQTNILALNAAVEAARAGAAGKGFAVVADEVRNLATKSAEAVKNTSALIESTVEAVANGTKIADDTANALNDVVEKSTKVDTLIHQIAKASDEQANGITQVSIGIEQISAVVQTNSATAEESAASAEELSSQSTILKQLVDTFKLNNNSPKNKQPIVNKKANTSNSTSKY
ncbi:MAG: methyl-accepting chemotaxis protein [Oscillospiraceae bacterium]